MRGNPTLSANYGTGGPGALITSVTETMTIPYRPKDDSDLHPVTPTRVFDTRARPPQGLVTVTKQQVGPSTPLEVQLTDLPGGIVPASGVGAVSLNVTAVGASGFGWVTVTPCGGATGTVCFTASVDVDIVVDINGWFEEVTGA